MTLSELLAARASPGTDKPESKPAFLLPPFSQQSLGRSSSLGLRPCGQSRKHSREEGHESLYVRLRSEDASPPDSPTSCSLQSLEVGRSADRPVAQAERAVLGDVTLSASNNAAPLQPAEASAVKPAIQAYAGKIATRHRHYGDLDPTGKPEECMTDRKDRRVRLKMSVFVIIQQLALA